MLGCFSRFPVSLSPLAWTHRQRPPAAFPASGIAHAGRQEQGRRRPLLVVDENETGPADTDGMEDLSGQNERIIGIVASETIGAALRDCILCRQDRRTLK